MKYPLIVAVILFSFLWNACGNESNQGRPQDPVEPYNYYTEEVIFRNDSANVTLAGTLTLPSKDGNYPAVVLISGSGPQNRDSGIAGHRPFLVLSDHLTKQGIAVLRYDDRGFGKSSGDFAAGTSLDFSYDAESAVKYLKSRSEINSDKIGLIGHSDGAMIAPMVAARSSDVNFIVLLAGPGLAGRELLLDRQAILERKLGVSEEEIRKSAGHSGKMIDIVITSSDSETAKSRLAGFSKSSYDQIPAYAVPPGMSKDDYVSNLIEMLSSPWFRFFLAYDPVPTLRKVRCPVLALNGDKDMQVPSTTNLPLMRDALIAGGNQNGTVRELANLNHFFQECVTGMPDEYARIEQTLAPVVLTTISDWIKEQTIIHK